MYLPHNLVNLKDTMLQNDSTNKIVLAPFADRLATNFELMVLELSAVMAIGENLLFYLFSSQFNIHYNIRNTDNTKRF